MEDDPLIAAPIRWSCEPTIASFTPYTCRLCSKSFSNTRALGGHQTAHRKEKRERFLRIIRRAEIDDLMYAADNDVVLSPEPISWLPPDTDDQISEAYNFMPMGNGSIPVPGSGSGLGSESMQGSVGSSRCSENKAFHVVDQKKKRKKNKFKEYKFMPMGKRTRLGPGSRSQSVQGLESELGLGSSGCSENMASDADQIKSEITKLMPSTKLTLATGAAPDRIYWFKV